MKAETRILQFLRAGPAALAEAARPGDVLLDAGERGAIAVAAASIRALLDQGSIAEEGGRLSLRHADRPSDRARPSTDKRDIGLSRIEDVSGTAADVLVNFAESPLAALMRRKSRDGASFLTQAEFGAGERLRADYTRARLMPRLGMNWQSPVASGRRGTGSGIADLTDSALAARLRVERALESVGPELSGVLVDICCFLKGLSQVESERGWPVRSAKLMLKSALAALARHYDPRAARMPKAGAILQWGADDYRPKTV